MGREKGSIVCVVEVFYLSKLRSLHVEMNNGQHFQLPSLYLGECVFNQFFQEDKKANFIEQMVSFLNNLYPQIPIMMNLPKKLSAQFYLKAEKTEAMLFQLKLRSTAHSPFQYLKQEDGPISAAWL